MGTDVRREPSTSAPSPVLGREWATSQARLPEFLEPHAGEHVLIFEEAVLGFFPSREEAVRAGYARVGVVPFLVHEVSAATKQGIPPWLQSQTG
jgi:hypothetical protein